MENAHRSFLQMMLTRAFGIVLSALLLFGLGSTSCSSDPQWSRITSYNVCYTKLLRSTMPKARVSIICKKERWAFSILSSAPWGKK